MSEEKEQYIYVLKLIPKLLNEDNWNEKENNIVERHFKYLKGLKEKGNLILAGKTLSIDENTFGIVIVVVENKKEARYMMNNDPAVNEGIMTAQLYPYNVALISEKNLK